jgi:hypothetical protein
MKTSQNNRWIKEWALIEKENKKMLKEIECWIIKGFGERCKILAGGCPVCRAWALYDAFFTYFG